MTDKQEEERLKKAVFEGMSPRRQKQLLKKGYDKWDPFLAPKDPIDIRRDQTRRTTQQLVRDFLQTRDSGSYSNEYGRGVLEMAMGIINSEERFLGMYDFCAWYREELKKKGPGTDCP